MNVRMISGPQAGEIKNLPFLAARGAIRSGLAQEIVEHLEAATVEAATVGPEPPRSLLGLPVLEDAASPPRQFAIGPPVFGKRHGRKR